MSKILVVDDNNVITDLVATILETNGYSCRVLNNGKDALQTITSDDGVRYDLVLLDIAMPDISGFDIVNELKKRELLQRYKIIFFTASSVTDSEIEDMKKIGVLDCIRKPFTKNELLHAVSRYCPI